MPGSPTAAQTALFLRKLEQGPLREFALLGLAEVVWEWRNLHPEISSEHDAFRTAFWTWVMTGSDEDWQRVVDTARPLARKINKYGEELLPEPKER